jgi:hypothetical protein
VQWICVDKDAMGAFSFGSNDSVHPGRARLQALFDAETDTPELLERAVARVPQLLDAMAALREGLPLVPNSGVGPVGRFYRLPNHYRSVSFALPPSERDDPDFNPGVIVFKGTEPLLADFPEYYDWMLGARFRSSALSLGLHFPLDMKLPPAAMWIEECLAEQAVSSKIQLQYFRRYGQLARLPLPLFVFKMTPEQVRCYEECISSRIPVEAMRKIRNKLTDGLGVEVYYYPELPVRVADLFVGKVRDVFSPFLASDQVEATCEKWTVLCARLLCLGYMPFAPWHHGMGGCVDAGNVCIDGGFNDLLTIVSFESIPDEILFRRSLQGSIQMLAESIAGLSAASIGIAQSADADAVSLAATFVTERLREHILDNRRSGYDMDERLVRFFEKPSVADILSQMHDRNGARGWPGQYYPRAAVHG